MSERLSDEEFELLAGVARDPFNIPSLIAECRRARQREAEGCGVDCRCVELEEIIKEKNKTIAVLKAQRDVGAPGPTPAERLVMARNWERPK